MKSIEKTIIELLKERDKKAISMLYDYYSDALFGIVNRIVKDEEKSKDVMQESFIKVWKNADKYDPNKAKLFTWLLRIFRNSAIDACRKKNNSNEEKIQNGSDFVGIGGKTSFNPDIMDIELHLQNMEVKYRKVIEKLYLQGMTHNEASEALDLPLGTIKSRARIGLTALRKIYLPLFILLIFHL